MNEPAKMVELGDEGFTTINGRYVIYAIQWPNGDENSPCQCLYCEDTDKSHAHDYLTRERIEWPALLELVKFATDGRK